MSILEDIQQLDAGTLLVFYHLDLRDCEGKFGETPGTLDYYWCDGVNELGNNVVWQGTTYERLPIQATGFDKQGSGGLPRPKLSVSNINYLIGNITKPLNDIVGGKLTRTRTFAKYIDAVNFSGGNPNADPTMFIDKEAWIIDRKSNENKLFIEWELTAPYDLLGLLLPRRQCIQNTCMWKYRSSECGYTGTNYFDANDAPTTQANDVCGKRVNSCKIRFQSSSTAGGGSVSTNTIPLASSPSYPIQVYDEAFGPIMNSFGIWSSNSSATSITYSYSVYFPNTSQYTIEVSTTNTCSVTVGGVQVANVTTANPTGYQAFSWTPTTSGMKTVAFTATKGTGKGGVAIIIKTSTDYQIFESQEPLKNNSIASGTALSYLPFGGFPGMIYNY